MVTANEVMKKSFEQTKMGYRLEEVDEFLSEVAQTIEALENENAQLAARREEDDKKIEVLVASIKQYRADEEAIKDAMIDARRQKQAIIAEAEEKAKEILADADSQAGEMKKNINANIDAEKAELERVKAEVKDFKKELLELYRDHITMISEIPGEITEDEEYEEEYEEIVEEDATKYFDANAVKEAADSINN